MDKDLISIKELAQEVGVSVQSIYKRINRKNDKIQPYLNQVNGKIFISKKAIDELYKTSELNRDLNQVEKDYKIPAIVNDQESLSKVIDILNEQILAYRKELEVKDKQIENLTELMKSNAQMLNQQQQLSLMDKQKILQLESAEDKKKRNLFTWLKNKKIKKEEM